MGKRVYKSPDKRYMCFRIKGTGRFKTFVLLHKNQDFPIDALYREMIVAKNLKEAREKYLFNI